MRVMSVSSAVKQKEMDFLPDHDDAGAVSPETTPRCWQPLQRFCDTLALCMMPGSPLQE